MFDGISRTRPATAPRLVPLTPELLAWAVLEERDPLAAEMAEGQAVARRLLNQWGFALIGRGHVLAAAGLVPRHAGRAECWLLVGREARPRDLVPELRRARLTLDKRQRDPFFRRLEAYVQWAPAWREPFMAALGFSLDGFLEAWDPAGRDYGLYSRVAPRQGA